MNSALWDDDQFVAADVETSGIKPEYALQAWRLPQGKAWLTSFAAVWRKDQINYSTGGIWPDELMIKEFLTWAIQENRVVVGWNIVFDIQWFLALGFKDLVYQIRWLDGMLIWRHYDIEPEYDESGRTKRKYSLKGDAIPTFLPQYVGYEEDINYHSTDPAELQKLHAYNIKDNLFALRIARILYCKLNSGQRQSLWTESRCLPMVAEANLRGLLVDTIVSKELSAELAAISATKLASLGPHGVTEAVVRSPVQLATLMYDQWKLPILKTTKTSTGKINRSTDKEALWELALMDGRAKELREYRESLNNKTKFVARLQQSVDYNDDWHVHPQARVFGTYCVPGDVEVLTREGWVRLDVWAGGEIVQVRPNLIMEFLPADKFVGPRTNEWVWLNQQGLDCLFTPGHTIPYIGSTGAWHTTKAGELADRRVFIPVAGTLVIDGQYTPDQMRLFAAIQADGSFVSKMYNGEPYAPDLKFNFKKARKVKRLCNLLQRLGIQFRSYVCEAYPDRTEIVISRTRLPDWCSKDCKVFGAWLLDTTTVGLLALLEETEFWDGSRHPDGGFKFSSSIKSNVEWVVTVASLVGRKAALHAPYAGMWECHVSDFEVRPVRQSYPRHRSAVNQNLHAFCATTQTGFWLARSRGTVFVTGNTGRITISSKQNATEVVTKQTRAGLVSRERKIDLPIGFAQHQMKRDKEFRKQIIAPEGYDMVEFDAAGQEFKWMAVASNDPVMLKLCMPGEDPHSYMVSQIYHEDYRNFMALVAQDDKPTLKKRVLGKIANFSLAYRTSAKKLRVVARVDYDVPMTQPEADLIWVTYQRTYTAVPHFWTNQIARVKALGYAETFAGRRVKVVGDWSGRLGWAMGSTAINYRIQGTGADQKYLAMSLLRDKLIEYEGYFAFDLHDGLYSFVPKARTQKFISVVKPLLDDLPYGPAWGFIPPVQMVWDCKIGSSWGTLKGEH